MLHWATLVFGSAVSQTQRSSAACWLSCRYQVRELIESSAAGPRLEWMARVNHDPVVKAGSMMEARH